MEVDQDPNWGCSTKEKMKIELFGLLFVKFCSIRFIQNQFMQSRSVSCVNADERIDF
jgi:hypothetical protein